MAESGVVIIHGVDPSGTFYDCFKMTRQNASCVNVYGIFINDLAWIGVECECVG